jgi:protein arginine kinase activator
MGESLHCDLCGKPATVHLTQIVKNQIQKVDLCEECAQSKGVTDPEGFSLAELLAKSFAGGVEEDVPENDAANLVCEQCGCSARDFKKSGRLGCASCYVTLRPLVMPLISSLHKGLQHRGKTPRRQWRRVELRREIETLERHLLEAIKQENFEAASRCRDQLAALKLKSQNELENPQPQPSPAPQK